MKRSVSTWLENIIGKSVETDDLNNLVKQIAEYRPEARNKLKQRLREQRPEEECAVNSLLEEES